MAAMKMRLKKEFEKEKNTLLKNFELNDSIFNFSKIRATVNLEAFNN
jgi:hypothetical protein